MNEMNDSRSSSNGSSCYEQLRVVMDMNDFMLLAQGFRYYEQLRVVDDMNDLGSRELQSLDALNSSRLRMTWIIFVYEPMMLNIMNNSWL